MYWLLIDSSVLKSLWATESGFYVPLCSLGDQSEVGHRGQAQVLPEGMTLEGVILKRLVDGCVYHLYLGIRVQRNFRSCFLQAPSDAYTLSYPLIHHVVGDRAKNMDGRLH